MREGFVNNSAFTLTNAIIIDPSSNYEGTGTITIEGGVISSINGVTKGTEIDCKNFYLAPGIIDMGVKICEPGERHKESFKSASAAAAAGGITTLVTRPDTNPPIDTPEILEFYMRRANAVTKIKIIPTATLTKGLNGKELTEMNFLSDNGAKAFTDGLRQISDTKLFLNALTYAADLNALVIGHPQDFSLSKDSAATAGKFATIQGLTSTPSLAEKIGLDRDLELIKKAKVKYHADQITTDSSLATIKRAKQEGLPITAGTSMHHLTLNELDISNYRTFFKLTPPLRSELDRIALVNGLIDGGIDTISSYHSPQDEESKRLPYEIAASGAVGLQTLLPACLQLVHDKQLSLPKLFSLISLNPAKILGIRGGILAKNECADLIIFDKDAPFLMDRFKLHSKSKNTPYDERTMQGKVLATFVNGNLIYENSDSPIVI